MTPRIPANLRINADDFGLSSSVSRSILRAAEEGLVNSTSAVPFRDAESLGLLAALGEVPNFRIGAHLTFIEVPLLTRPASFPDGSPPGDYRAFLAALLRGKIHSADVRTEWKAQLDLLRQRLGIKPVHHLDSHQHLHLLPSLWKITVELQRDYGISAVRRPYEGSRRAWLKSFPMGAGLQALAATRPGAAEERFIGAGASMRFAAEPYRSFAAETLSHPDQPYELMVHLGEDERGQAEAYELRRWLQFMN
jgi:predicted glycoside hydrolase/deacetylase ChbG (UPF0249 family)